MVDIIPQIFSTSSFGAGRPRAANYPVRFQRDDFDCGPAALVNSLRALGVRISGQLAEELAGTTLDGTDEFGLQGAIRKLGYEFEELNTPDSGEAWDWLCRQVREGRASILCVENYTHWTTVIGVLGDDRIIYVDSQDGVESNRRENGVRSLTRSGLTRLWGSRGRGKRRRYYAISVAAPPKRRRRPRQ